MSCCHEWQISGTNRNRPAQLVNGVFDVYWSKYSPVRTQALFLCSSLCLSLYRGITSGHDDLNSLLNTSFMCCRVGIIVRSFITPSPPICISIYLSVCLSIDLINCPSAHLPVYAFINLYVCGVDDRWVCVYFYVYVNVYARVCMFIGDIYIYIYIIILHSYNINVCYSLFCFRDKNGVKKTTICSPRSTQNGRCQYRRRGSCSLLSIYHKVSKNLVTEGKYRLES